MDKEETVNELFDRKLKLEAEINALIFNFNLLSPIKVVDLNVVTVNEFGGDVYCYTTAELDFSQSISTR